MFSMAEINPKLHYLAKMTSDKLADIFVKLAWHLDVVDYRNFLPFRNL